MSKKKKLLNRFLSIPSDLSWNELVSVLQYLGYDQVGNGMTGGSRRRFINQQGKLILLHEPHPKRIVKKYVIRLIISHCQEEINRNE
jgi:predicted RNA binding protein YcfA (HicA-like mRNA interferase family)